MVKTKIILIYIEKLYNGIASVLMPISMSFLDIRDNKKNTILTHNGIV